MDLSIVGLRVLREIAERGSFTAAAAALGYTQSAVSRQVAALENATRTAVFVRRRGGVELTAAGRTLLRHAAVILNELDEVGRELGGASAAHGTVRLGAFASAGAVLVPRALLALSRSHPGIDVTTREASSPSLARALRAGSLDLAVLALAPPFRAPDTDSPRLALETLREVDLMVAVPAAHPLAAQDSLRLADLRGQRWIASRSTGDETVLGVWPGLDERPRIAHVTRDWLAKLQLVAAGCGLTTAPVLIAGAVPAGVRLLPVDDGPRERRRLVLARLPGEARPAVGHVRQALRAALA
jgi:DNA-binding transcriptional LysR family regulator